MGRAIVYGIIAAILFVIVFVRAGELGGKSGGEQASLIIGQSAKGFASIVNALQGQRVTI